MNKYLFLLAWVDGSDSACGEATRVRNFRDLEREYLNGNEHVLAVVINADSESLAEHLGYREAFFNNYTAHDSVSTTIEINDGYNHPRSITELRL